MESLFAIETDRLILRWDGPKRPRAAWSLSLNQTGWLHINPGDGVPVVVRRSGVPEGARELADISEGPLLFEQTLYQVYARAKDGSRVEILHRDPVIRDRLRPIGPDVVSGGVNFRGDVGRSEFEVRLDGRREFTFEVEVFPSKLDYKSDYEAMLAEVTDIMMALALEYMRSTYRLSTAFHVPEPSQVEWLVLLRHVIDDLERALLQVSRRPERRLRRDVHYIRPERVRRVDSTVRKAVARGRGAGAYQEIPSVGGVRMRIPEQLPRETLDTPEHRWLRTQLDAIRYRLVDVSRSERRRRGRSRHQETTLTELAEMEQRVGRLLRLEPLAHAVGAPPPNFSSLVLQQSVGYREAYTACLVLRLGLRLEGGPLKLSLKDINTLYEYWCYLSLVKIVAEELDAHIDPAFFIKRTVSGLRVDLQRGQTKEIPLRPSRGGYTHQVKISYNPSHDTPTGRQQPDVGLGISITGWQRPFNIIFDAKYRLDASSDYIRRYGTVGPPEDAVNVLHRYRDAILGSPGGGRRSRKLIAGAALFPLHDPERHFERNTFYKALDEVGIGALPFLPSEMGFVRAWFRRLLEQTGWELSDRAVGDRTVEEVARWQREAAEAALIAILRPGVGHMDWIKQNRIYYLPLDGPIRLGPRRFVAKWIAFYEGQRDRGTVGAIAHEAAVERVDVVPRRDIQTPWKSRDPDELCIIYTLGPVRERVPPIEAPEGIRSFRWASRLSLSRATTVRELYIETEAEWRLYDGLKTRGVEFELRPGRAHVPDPWDVRGRATFVIGDAQVRYVGAAGFRLDRPGKTEFYALVDAVIGALITDEQ